MCLRILQEEMHVKCPAGSVTLWSHVSFLAFLHSLYRDVQPITFVLLMTGEGKQRLIASQVHRDTLAPKESEVLKLQSLKKTARRLERLAPCSSVNSSLSQTRRVMKLYPAMKMQR
ncbi:mitogen-activated protein kinase kinase kinase 4 [Platysternon megacephalum]|uniref:Mitogen-activated protein kinase kinase kinase 4 n=1 Tax=Platysternon megacephalum TaxID=55544 RepID=A0A4D9DU16_9SAUR|nr:mitogen-activated protein kinase kinase kinase 4 [Platysternon megacephalum]